jgi:hypothetical protein
MADLRPEHTPVTTLEFPAPKVAALFVEWGGVYFQRDDVVPCGVAVGKDQNRSTRIILDARIYNGPYPVIAHPPCNRWGSMSHMKRSVDFAKIGADGGCFESALKSVRAWGGVIEHPAKSKAWTIYHLSKPKAYHRTARDLHGGFSIFVNQCHYGHLALKPTWLYICGYRGDFDEDFDIPQGTKPVKYGLGTSKARHARLGHLRLPEKFNKRTPELFADLLISIAKRCTFYRDHWTYHLPDWLKEKR